MTIFSLYSRFGEEDRAGAEVLTLVSCSTLLSNTIILLTIVHLSMPKSSGILTFNSKINKTFGCQKQSFSLSE